ncbi:MAG: polysaccharide deacetylase family protein [Oscillatoriophycideae cyanobacterium NC_groundwater_1537_Pr4_S-0.65um_50_18]|nr:polysaccharide deacetylase family protein [Oscillatoriophycideae cyanobacterium NC_groundwater_1537_Pr4_S-0.65um_50_18]
MTSSIHHRSTRFTSSQKALYQPSVIELAQAGNCQALTYWMNSLLASQGVSVQVQPAAKHYLKIFVDFQPLTRKEVCISLRDRLVRFICYRLWTLNSSEIFSVQILARVSGSSRVLWQQTVRINTPANSQRLRQIRALHPKSRQESSFAFQFLRSLLLSSVTLAGFYIGYRLLYLEISKLLSKPSAAQPTTSAYLAHQMPYGTLQMLPNSVNSDEGIIRADSEAKVASVKLISAEIQGERVPKRFQGETVLQVAGHPEKAIALTFEDGPWPGATEQILDILQQHHVRATFFMVGLQIKRFPELAKQVAQAGHAIGNHTWNHPLQEVSLADAASEINDMEKLIYEITGVKPELFRPPGEVRGELTAYARQQKYVNTLWSIDAQDPYVSSPILIDNVLKQAQPGRIVLMHDGGGDRSATVHALPQIISALKQQGYRLITVPELLSGAYTAGAHTKA